MNKIVVKLIVGAFMLSSCIKENMSDCPEEIRIYFDVATRPDIQIKEIDKMNLYVFSDKGDYLGEYSDDNIRVFDAGYHINCSDLVPGNYHFVAWAGKHERDYSVMPEPFIKGKTRLYEALLILKHSDGIVINNIHHLFHAKMSATVTRKKEQAFFMPLVQHSNTINIYTEGFPVNDYSYIFEITDRNGEYKFDRSFAKTHTDLTYLSDCQKDENNQLFSTLNVMRLSEDRNTPRLRIYNKTTGATLYPVGMQSGNLIELIKSAYPNNDFETTHNYDILFCFNGETETDMSVTIFINGWMVREQEGNLN